MCFEQSAMELMDAIKNRRAVRDYTDAPVEHSVIERLIEAAILAPSAMNLQPWSFAVVLGREHIENYAKRAKHWFLQVSHKQPMNLPLGT